MAQGIRTGACDDWQPPSMNDTRAQSGCWKDKWFQQLSGVLDNWEEYSRLSYVRLDSLFRPDTSRIPTHEIGLQAT